MLQLICLALLLTGFLYAFTSVYNFPKFKPFAGEVLYNPYEQIEGIKPLKGNFHAHTSAWGGITNGNDTNAEVVEEYVKRNYDVISISNYHFIDEYLKNTDRVYISNYEHGYNVFKSHKLGLNADKVSFLDFPFYQWPSHKQKILEVLNANNASPIVAHPKFVNGHNFNDLKYLVNYSLMEVLNHYRISDAYWDVALSNGHPVYIVGSDDTHDLVKEPTFRKWTIIFSEDSSTEKILQALTTGSAYGVDSDEKRQDIFLMASATNELTFIHEFSKAAKSISVIGKGGKILSEVTNASSISYTFKPDDTYARIFVKSESCDLYLNPVFRYDGKTVPTNYVDNLKQNFIKTWLFRLLSFLLCICAIFAWIKIYRF